MGKRTDLHEILCEILGSRNVYYQPPKQMKYPAIKYSLSDIDEKHADNKHYLLTKRYQVMIIDHDPDSEIGDRLMELPMCSFDRSYPADGLNHFVYTLYY